MRSYVICVLFDFALESKQYRLYVYVGGFGMYITVTATICGKLGESNALLVSNGLICGNIPLWLHNLFGLMCWLCKAAFQPCDAKT